MAKELDMAWKVLADPTASEEKWAKACAAVGDKKPPASFLRENSQLFERARISKVEAVQRKTGLLLRRTASSAIDVFCLSIIYCGIMIPAAALLGYPGYSLLETVGASVLIAGLEQLFRYFILMLPLVLGGPILSVDVMMIGLFMAAAWSYNSVLPSSRLRGTVGQYVMGLTIVDNHGRQITLRRATARYFAGWLSTVTFLMGYLLPIINKRSQSLHDVVAGCEVIRRSEQQSLIEMRSHL